MTPKEYYQSVVTAPEVWGNVHLKGGYPEGKTQLQNDSAAYLALTPEQQGVWATWNTALQRPFEDVQPVGEGSVGYAEVIVAYSFCAALYRSLPRLTCPQVCETLTMPKDEPPAAFDNLNICLL